MAVWSTVSVASAMETDRFDGDYFKPSDLAAINLIRQKGGEPLSSLCTILMGRTPSDYDESGSLSVVRSGDLVAPLIYPMCERQFLRAHPSSDRIRLQCGDLLISSIGMGSIGKISLVADPANLITVSEVTILRNAKVAPEYLFAYLASSTGQAQIEREVTGATGQQHLLKAKVSRILVPAAPKGVVSIRDMVRHAHQQQEAGRAAYAEAEALLESALGLDKLDLTPRLFYERPYVDAQIAGRCDAEYFNPRMQNLIAALSRDHMTITNVAKLAKRRFKPMPSTQFQYIEIADITGSGTAESNPVAGDEAPSRATWIVKPSELLADAAARARCGPLQFCPSVLPYPRGKTRFFSGYSPLGGPPPCLTATVRLPYPRCR